MCVVLFLSLALSLSVSISVLCSITFNLVPSVFCTDVVFVSLAFINCWPVGLKKSTISNSFFLASLKKPKEKLFARVADQLLVLLFFRVCGFNCWVYHFKFKRKERNEFTFIRLDTLLLATSRPFFPTFFSLENSFPHKIAFISFSFLDHYLTILYFACIFAAGHVWIVTVAKHRDFIAIVLILIRVFSGSILRKTEKIDN